MYYTFKIMRRLKLLSLLIALASAYTCYSQEFTWKLGYNYFFDNAEYGSSSYSQSQTLHGMNLMPEIGLKLDSRQTIYTGVNLLKIVGSPSFTNGQDFLAYYQYKTPSVKFRAGSFPKEDMFDKYSEFLFKDSIRYFRPVMQGLYLKINNRHNDFLNVWLDWTGYGSKDIRESFFVGASGLKRHGVLFGEMQSYLFHYANTTPTNESFNVCEQFQMQLSVGASYSNMTGLDTLQFAIGGLIGLERDRGVKKDFDKPIGLTMRFNVEYNGLGTDNMAYFGNPRMSFYDKLGSNLYWGTPFLRDKSYIESKWYARLIKSDRVNAKIGLNMHLTERQLFFQQTITLSVNINKQRDSKQHTNNMFPLMNFFPK